MFDLSTIRSFARSCSSAKAGHSLLHSNIALCMLCISHMPAICLDRRYVFVERLQHLRAAHSFPEPRTKHTQREELLQEALQVRKVHSLG